MIDYNDMKVPELRKLAAAKGKTIGMQTTEMRTRWSKTQIIAFLRDGTVPTTSAPVMEITTTLSNGLADDAHEVIPEHTAPAPAGMKMEFSTFSRKTDSTAKHLILLDKQAFIDLLSTHLVRTKKDGKLFSPAMFTGTRSNDNFISASGICIDFDHGQPSIRSVLDLFNGTLAAYYSTHSHTPEYPRFRIVIPLSRPVNADEHGRLVAGVKSIITSDLNECIDSTCFERARPHYLPSCPPEHELHAFTGHQDGQPLNVVHFLSLGSMVAPPATGQTEDQPKPAPAAPRNFEFINPATGEIFNLTTWAVLNPAFDIIAAIDRQFFRGDPTKEGKQHITCPFEDQHTDKGDDLATFIASASPPRHATWNIHCCHAHCDGRDRLEFIQAMLENGWISADQLQAKARAAIERRRPPKVYFPVNDIKADPAWTPLMHGEKRVALDLVTMFWEEIDGMIADDDWAIARRLGMAIEEWQSYRGILTRTGWLIETDGRLTNIIAKREFDKAQDAYMRGIAKSKKGGEVTQEKARLKQLEVAA